MTALIKRTLSRVNPEYFSAKLELESKAVKGQCIICHNPLGKGRKKYCSKECFDSWFQKFNPPFRWKAIRWKAMMRDRWRCVVCKLGRKDLNAKHLGTKYERSPKIFVDHITPVSIGGAEFDLSNLQTLCIDCNRKKTREDMKHIAKVRRKIVGEEKSRTWEERS